VWEGGLKGTALYHLGADGRWTCAHRLCADKQPVLWLIQSRERSLKVREMPKK
jgi:hypothetical protein